DHLSVKILAYWIILIVMGRWPVMPMVAWCDLSRVVVSLLVSVLAVDAIRMLVLTLLCPLVRQCLLPWMAQFWVSNLQAVRDGKCSCLTLVGGILTMATCLNGW